MSLSATRPSTSVPPGYVLYFVSPTMMMSSWAAIVSWPLSVPLSDTMPLHAVPEHVPRVGSLDAVGRFCEWIRPLAGRFRSVVVDGPQPVFVDLVLGLATRIFPLDFSVIVVFPVYRQPVPPTRPSACSLISVFAGGNASSE